MFKLLPASQSIQILTYIPGQVIAVVPFSWELSWNGSPWMETLQGLFPPTLSPFLAN